VDKNWYIGEDINAKNWVNFRLWRTATRGIVSLKGFTFLKLTLYIAITAKSLMCSNVYCQLAETVYHTLYIGSASNN